MFSAQDKPRIGRSGYWTAFVINVVAVIALLGGALALAFSGRFAVALLLIFLVIPVGLYFRVVMMRRCRDIGWPAALPWLFFGAALLANMTRLGGGLEGLRDPGAAIFPALVGLADFAFMILIGCIAGETRGAAYARYFEPDEDEQLAARAVRPAAPGPARIPQGYAAAPQAPLSREAEEANWDAAIARALEQRQRGEAPENHRPVAPPVQRPAPGIQRPAGGFGRRGV